MPTSTLYMHYIVPLLCFFLGGGGGGVGTGAEVFFIEVLPSFHFFTSSRKLLKMLACDHVY